MNMNEISTADYQIFHDQESQSITLSGVLRLGSGNYQPIDDLLSRAATQEMDRLVLDLRNLSLLNSAGINTLVRFLIRVRDKKLCSVMVRGNQAFAWQRKTLRNFQRLMGDIPFDLEWSE
jgi:hypothetical protein